MNDQDSSVVHGLDLLYNSGAVLAIAVFAILIYTLYTTFSGEYCRLGRAPNSLRLSPK